MGELFIVFFSYDDEDVNSLDVKARNMSRHLSGRIMIRAPSVQFAIQNTQKMLGAFPCANVLGAIPAVIFVDIRKGI